MNTCCLKTLGKLWSKLLKELPNGKREMGGGCPRCKAYLTVKVEGVI